MSAQPEFPADDLGSLSNAALMRLLQTSEEDERVVSELRSKVHEQLDGMSADEEGTFELQHEERMLSERRLRLHQRITELRLERGRRISGLRSELRIVELPE